MKGGTAVNIKNRNIFTRGVEVHNFALGSDLVDSKRSANELSYLHIEVGRPAGSAVCGV